MNTDMQAMIIQNDRLTVEIAKPGSAYSGTRFDWSGFITQITLDGRHTFCMPESLQAGQGTGGIGLCNEFGIDAPIGYSDALPGQAFPKLGVGLLKRPADDEYHFALPHDVETLFTTTTHTGTNELALIVEPLDCRGYAARLTKTITLKANQMSIAYHLENTGTQPIRTNEYCHNYVGFNQQPIGPDYQLRFPYSIALEPMNERFMEWTVQMLLVQDNVIQPRLTPPNAFYCRPLGFHATQQAQWELTHLPSGVIMREYDDFAPCRVAVWGTTHVISAEVFVAIDLAPGASQRWTRRYEFTG